jgi:hypothetical protein
VLRIEDRDRHRHQGWGVLVKRVPHGWLAWLAPVVALASLGLVACLPVPPDRPLPENQSFPGPPCLDDP